jgi:acyl-coenzyme A synthetase/AMP-(fatty) acid ligase
MTGDYIAFHASQRPDAAAFVVDGREFGYGRLAHDIAKVTRALREFALPRGAKVLIAVTDVYFGWLLRLAFERLGVATCEGRTFPAFLKDFDLILSDDKVHGGSAARRYEATSDWLRRALARAGGDEAAAEPTLGPDEGLRIVQTSGTTGTPKRLLYSRQVHEGSIAAMMWFANFTHRSRYLGVAPSVAVPTACIRAGGTVVFEGRMAAAEALAAHAITHVKVVPIVLKRLLDELPGGFAGSADLKVFSSGAPLSSGLRSRVRTRLAAAISDIYGTFEAGFVSSIHDDTPFGSVWPGVEVEVVGDDDEPVPPGNVGRIRVRTDRMVQEYVDDPEATSRMFKDGWFYARDLGVLEPGRRLQVIGRSDEVINVGGKKLSPEVLEDLVVRIGGAGDAGACSIRNTDGIEEIVIAVSAVKLGPQELLEKIKPALAGWPFGRVDIVKVDRIPRNANGKIQRDLLRTAAAGCRAGAVQPTSVRRGPVSSTGSGDLLN